MKYREYLKDVSPYVPGKSEEEIKKQYNLEKVVKIASNENPYGATPKVLEMMKNINFNIYPDNYVTNLRETLSKELGVKKEELLFGNGSVEIIQMLSRILLNNGDNIITELPSFSSYFSEAKIQGANIKTISYNEKYSFNLSEMLELIDDNTKMIYITNPNNPLGTVIHENELTDFIAKVPKNILVVIDEAYYEYVRDEKYISCIELVNKYENVCVLRTFSKAYGLAALRIGYIVASSPVITELEKVRVPFNVSTIAQECASIALNDKEHLNYVVTSTHNVIDFMYKELDRLNIEYIKTQANFVMINVKRNSKEVTQKLLERGYIVRDGFPLMNSWLRVSVGTLEEMKGFIAVLKEVI